MHQGRIKQHSSSVVVVSVGESLNTATNYDNYDNYCPTAYDDTIMCFCNHVSIICPL